PELPGVHDLLELRVVLVELLIQGAEPVLVDARSLLVEELLEPLLRRGIEHVAPVRLLQRPAPGQLAQGTLCLLLGDPGRGRDIRRSRATLQSHHSQYRQLVLHALLLSRSQVRRSIAICPNIMSGRTAR